MSVPADRAPPLTVITFDHFVTDEECDAFISTTQEHFARSLAGDVVSPVHVTESERMGSLANVTSTHSRGASLRG